MGWGTIQDPPAQTLARDMRVHETYVETSSWNADFPSFKDRHITGAQETPYERKIREELLQIDDGWGFWEAEKLAYGNYLQPGPQNIGNCVGYSHALLIASKHAHEILVEGQLEEPLGHYDRVTPVPYVPYSYGIGRVFVGKGRIRGDGSLCAWQITATMEHGFLPSNTPGLTGPFPQSTSAIGREFGRSRGVLDRWREKASTFDLADSLKIGTADEAKDVLTVAKCPIQICSGWGFGRPFWDSKREIWIYRRSGSWSHSMQIVGCIEVKGEWFIVVRNQWGTEYHKDPGRGIPRGCFIIGLDLLAAWLRDAYASTIGQIVARKSQLLA